MGKNLQQRLQNIESRNAKDMIKQAPLKENVAEKPKKESVEKAKISFGIPMELKEKLSTLGLSITKTMIKATEEFIERNYKEALDKMKEEK